jgi:hypothetical protein
MDRTKHLLKFAGMFCGCVVVWSEGNRLWLESDLDNRLQSLDGPVHGIALWREQHNTLDNNLSCSRTTWGLGDTNILARVRCSSGSLDFITNFQTFGPATELRILARLSMPALMNTFGNHFLSVPERKYYYYDTPTPATLTLNCSCYLPILVTREVHICYTKPKKECHILLL